MLLRSNSDSILPPLIHPRINTGYSSASQTLNKVRKILENNSFSENGIKLLLPLCTLDGALPQGSPTSPVLSNAAFYLIDESMYEYCRRRNLKYTRYSDDITISGDSKSAILKAQTRLIAMAEGKKAGFKVNKKKTRLMPYHTRQQVTGVVVNERPTPPREEMRKVRAKFDHAYKSKFIDTETRNQLLGYISYLSAFDKYKESPLLVDSPGHARGTYCYASSKQ